MQRHTGYHAASETPHERPTVALGYRRPGAPLTGRPATLPSLQLSNPLSGHVWPDAGLFLFRRSSVFGPSDENQSEFRLWTVGDTKAYSELRTSAKAVSLSPSIPSVTPIFSPEGGRLCVTIPTKHSAIRNSPVCRISVYMVAC